MGLSNKKNIVDTRTYKGIFACIKYLIENKLILKEDYSFSGYENDAEIIYHLVGEPERALNEYINLEIALSKDSLPEDAVEDLKTMWKNKRKDIFVKSHQQEDPDVSSIIRKRLKEQLEIEKSANYAQFAKNYNTYIEGDVEDYENFYIDGMSISRYLKNTNVPLHKLIAITKYFSEKNGKEITMDYFLDLDMERSGNIQSMAILFDALMDMKNNHIFGPFEVVPEGIILICIYDPIAKYFFDAYIEDCDAITSEESEHSFLIKDRSPVNIEKLKEERFQETTERFAEKKIPATMPKKIQIVKLPKETSLDGCIRWLNNHPEGQADADYRKERDEYNKKKEEEIEAKIDDWAANQPALDLVDYAAPREWVATMIQEQEEARKNECDRKQSI